MYFFTRALTERISRESRLRRVLFLEILLIFCCYAFLFVYVASLSGEQRVRTAYVTNRGQMLQDLQRLEQYTYEQHYSVHMASETARVTQFTRAYGYFRVTTDSLRTQLSELEGISPALAEQERSLARNLLAAQEQFGRVQEQTYGLALPSSPIKSVAVTHPLESTGDGLFEQILTDIRTWQGLAEYDLVVATGHIDRLQQLRTIMLSIQALVVVLSLIIISFTYVSPSFERIAQRLSLKNKQLRQLDALKTEFLSIAGHQLRTPLSELKWTLSMWERESRHRVTAKEREFFGSMRESVGAMAGLLSNLLNVSRIEEGRLVVRPQRVNIATIIRSVVREAKKVAQPRHVAITLDIADGPTMGMVDPLLFRQVMQNLVDNAVKYNRHGGEVSIKLALSAGNWMVSVSDTGVGVRQEDMSRLFTKFFRGANAVMLQPDGLGLGLYFIKKIIEKHGGRISVKSIIDRGTTFTVSVPGVAPSKSIA